MDIDEERIGVWPNVAVMAGTEPTEAMERHGVTPPEWERDESAWLADEYELEDGRISAVTIGGTRFVRED